MSLWKPFPVDNNTKNHFHNFIYFEYLRLKERNFSFVDIYVLCVGFLFFIINFFLFFSPIEVDFPIYGYRNSLLLFFATTISLISLIVIVLHIIIKEEKSVSDIFNDVLFYNMYFHGKAFGIVTNFFAIAFILEQWYTLFSACAKIL